jgi:aspartyl-tRNA(Asn)/glutamyl-tRNA(Gln) amidotransferase subunit C
MKLTKEEVKKIGTLARIDLSDAELEKFSNQLTDILQYVDMLSEVDTSSVEPTYQVTGLTNVFEADQVLADPVKSEDLLKCSALNKEARQIVVKKVL